MEVLIVDDHPLIHRSLRAVVAKAIPGAKVRAETDFSRGVATARRMPDLRLVLLDLGLPGFTGIEALRAFRKTVPEPLVAIVSATDDPVSVREALNAGASGYIPKSSLASVAVGAVRTVMAGGVYQPLPVISVPEVPRSPLATLSPRQRNVLDLVAKGLGNREIAGRLGITEDTVKQHVHLLFTKLGVSSRTEALVVAARLGVKAD